MNENFEQTAEQAAAFQKIWLDSANKIFQAAGTLAPDAASPEVLRQIRGGILAALAQSWDEFMRSPQFQQGMKQWLEQAMNFQKLSNEFMARVRNELQAPSRGDMDSVMLTIRHMEKRLLDRIEELAGRVNALQGHGGSKAAKSRQTKRARRQAKANTIRAKAV